jgi:hypothetical protein
MAVSKTTKIRVLGETWHVPRGFGRVYARVLREDIALFRAGKPGEISGRVIDLLGLIGYEVTLAQVADWDLRRRVEAVVYAANEYARASDNPLPRHPHPSWLPDQPWQGPMRGKGAFAGPSGTPIE